MSRTAASGKKKSVHTIRDGAIEVAVREVQGDKGTFYNATTRRSYKQGDQWNLTNCDETSPVSNVLPLQDIFWVECVETADKN